MGKAVDFIWATIQTALTSGITRGSFELCPGVGQITAQQFLKRLFGEITMLVEGQRHSLTYWILSLSGGSGPSLVSAWDGVFKWAGQAVKWRILTLLTIEGRQHVLWRWPAGTLWVQEPALDPNVGHRKALEEPLRFPCIPPLRNQLSEILIWQMLSSCRYIPETCSVLKPLLEKQFKLVVKGTGSGTGLLGLKTQLCCSCCGTLWPPVATFVKWGSQ